KAPIDTSGWEFSMPINFGPGNDEVILVDGANEEGFVFYAQPRKLFFCDSTVVEFKFKADANSNGGTDGFAFWILSSKSNNYAASPGLGIPLNSTGHVVIFDLFDNDNNTNNPIVGSRYFTNQNYTEGTTTGQIAGNTDEENVVIPRGVWHKVKLLYTFNGGTVSNVNLEIFLNGTSIWTGRAFNALPNLNTYFGFSASNGVSNFSNMSFDSISVRPYPLPPETIIPVLCTDQQVLPYVFP